jgi:hypothetical protein
MKGAPDAEKTQGQSDQATLVKFKKSFKAISKILINFLGNILIEYVDYLDTVKIPTDLLGLLSSTLSSDSEVADQSPAPEGQTFSAKELESAFQLSGGKLLFLLQIFIDTFGVGPNSQSVSDISKQLTSERFKSELTECLFSTDNEEKKMGYSLLEMASTLIITAPEYRQTYSDCITLFTNLDSFAKHLIKPMWDGKLRTIIATMNSDALGRDHPKLFKEFSWFLDLIVKKALSHPNINMYPYFSNWLLKEVTYGLPIFEDFVLKTVIPLVGLSGLYSEMSQNADGIPKVRVNISNFMKNLWTSNETWFRENIRHVVAQGAKIQQFNAMPTFWNAFTVLDQDCNARGLSLEGVDLESLSGMWIKNIRDYPPYSRSVLIRGVLGLLKCCDVKFDQFKYFVKFFECPDVKGFFNSRKDYSVVPMVREILDGSGDLWANFQSLMENFVETYVDGDKPLGGNEIFWVSYFLGNFNATPETAEQTLLEKRKILFGLDQILDSLFTNLKKVLISPYYTFSDIKNLINIRLVPILSILVN